MEEKAFLKGLFVKKNPKSPDFVIGQISIKREDLIAELQTMSDEWINLDILKKKDESDIYAKINKWKAEKKTDLVPEEDVEFVDLDDNSIPF